MRKKKTPHILIQTHFLKNKTIVNTAFNSTKAIKKTKQKKQNKKQISKVNAKAKRITQNKLEQQTQPYEKIKHKQK